MTLDIESIYQKAIDHYGIRSQMIVAIEELSELQKELTKVLRDKADYRHLAEEMADVEIMMEQLRLMFHPITNMIGEYKENKLLRLNHQINEENE